MTKRVTSLIALFFVLIVLGSCSSPEPTDTGTGETFVDINDIVSTTTKTTIEPTPTSTITIVESTESTTIEVESSTNAEPLESSTIIEETKSESTSSATSTNNDDGWSPLV